jgi:hypothetical protein
MKRAWPWVGAVVAALAVAAAPRAAAQSSGLAGSAGRPPRAAAPASGESWRQYLIDARTALREDRPAGAREALERAETRLLGHDPASLTQGAHPRLLQAAMQARAALASHDPARASEIIDTVLAVRVADVSPPVVAAEQLDTELAYPPPAGALRRR